MNKLKGGKADKLKIEDIAKKHSVFIGTVKQELERGIKVELEHTKDKNQAEEIAMDHLFEDIDYYKKLSKMEAKECTDASSSGAVEMPVFAITKRKLAEMIKKHKINEIADSGISAGAMFDAPIGTAGPVSPMDKTKRKRKDPLAIDNVDEDSGTILGNEKMDKIAIKSKPKNFPMWVKGGKYVAINPAVRKFPYMNQGAGSDGAWKGKSNMKVYSEDKDIRRAIEIAAKKYKLTVEEVEKMIVKEAYSLPGGIDFSPALTWGKDKGPKYMYHLVTIDPETGEPAPMDLTTKDETAFEKLKLILHQHDIRFKEEKRPMTSEDEKPETAKPSDDDDTDFGDDEDDIFAKYKK